MDESVQRTQKAASNKAEILHDLLVGMENLSDNVKQLKEEMCGYGDPEVQKELDEVLMKEADETLPVAMDQVPLSVPLSVASVSYPLSSEPVLTPRPSSSKMGNKELKAMQEKLNSLRSSVPEVTCLEMKIHSILTHLQA